MDSLEVLPIIFGVVEFLKKLGMTGNKLTIASAIVGVLLVALWQASQLFPQISPWVKIILMGLAGGMAACGVYDFINKRLPAKKADLPY